MTKKQALALLHRKRKRGRPSKKFLAKLSLAKRIAGGSIQRSRSQGRQRFNPSVMCGYCGTGNKIGKDLCWKCGFDLGATPEARVANIARRTARSLGQSRRNPIPISSIDFDTLMSNWNG